MSGWKAIFAVLLVINIVGVLTLKAAYDASHQPRWSDSYPEYRNDLELACAGILTNYTMQVAADYDDADVTTPASSTFANAIVWHFEQRTLLLFTFIAIQVIALLSLSSSQVANRVLKQRRNA